MLVGMVLGPAVGGWLGASGMCTTCIYFMYICSCFTDILVSMFISTLLLIVLTYIYLHTILFVYNTRACRRLLSRRSSEYIRLTYLYRSYTTYARLFSHPSEI